MATAPRTPVPLRAPALTKILRQHAGPRPHTCSWWHRVRSHCHQQRAAALAGMPSSVLADPPVAAAAATDPAGAVRRAFCLHAGWRRLKVLAPALLQLTADPCPGVRRQALAALATTDRRLARRAAVAALASADPEIRFQGLDALAENSLLSWGKGRLPTPLLAALKDPRPEIAARAGDWLARLAGPEHLPALEHALKSARPGQRQSLWRIAIAASDLGSEETFVLDLLLQQVGRTALESPSASPCARALSRRRDAAAAGRILAHESHIHPAWHSLMCRALSSRRDDPQALAFLLRLIQTSEVDAAAHILPLATAAECFFHDPPFNRVESFRFDDSVPTVPWTFSFEVLAGSRRESHDWGWHRWRGQSAASVSRSVRTSAAFQHHAIQTALHAARAFQGWTSAAAFRQLLHIRIHGGPNSSRIAGFALQIGGRWETPFSCTIADHLADRPWRGLQAWWSACRDESPAIVAELMALRGTTLPWGERAEQMETGFCVSVQAANLPVVEHLLTSDPALIGLLPAQLLGLADSGCWDTLEKLGGHSCVLPVLLQCRDALGRIALRQLQMDPFLWCENLDPSRLFDWVPELLPAVMAAAYQLPWWHISRRDLEGMSHLSPSIRAALPRCKDELIRLFITEEDVDHLIWIVSIAPEVPTTIRPSEFTSLFQKLASRSPHALFGWSGSSSAWDTLEAIAEQPFFRPCFLDSRAALMALALQQGRVDRFEWLESLCPGEPIPWESFVFTALDHLLAVPLEPAMITDPAFSTATDIDTLQYLLGRLAPHTHLEPQLSTWLGPALNQALHCQSHPLLDALAPLVSDHLEVVYSRAQEFQFTRERVLRAIFQGRIEEARWLLYFFGSRFRWPPEVARLCGIVIAKAIIRQDQRAFAAQIFPRLATICATLMGDGET